MPRSWRSTAQIAMIWSPSINVAAAVDRQHPVGVTVEREPGVGPVTSTTARLQVVGMGRAAPSLMFVPFGSAWMTTTSAPSRRSTCGAIVVADPLAQSTTTRRPDRSRPSTSATTASA